MGSFICLVFYLYLHVCSGRMLGIALNRETGMQVQPTGQIFAQGSWRAEHGDSIRNGADNMQLENDKAFAVEEAQHIKANPMKRQDFLMDLQIGAELKAWGREERSTLESVGAAENTEETIKSKDGDALKDDVQVMDYAQAHRKPPIHNKGT